MTLTEHQRIVATGLHECANDCPITLRDGLAHSYADELPEKYEWEPYRFSIADVAKFLVGMTLLYGFVISLVILGAAAQ